MLPLISAPTAIIASKGSLLAVASDVGSEVRSVVLLPRRSVAEAMRPPEEREEVEEEAVHMRCTA